MIHHLKGCLEDRPLDHIILQHATNDLKSNDTFEEMTDKILNLAALFKANGYQVFNSGLAIRNNYQGVNVEPDSCHLLTIRILV